MNREIIAKAEQIVLQRTGLEAKEGMEPYCTISLIDEYAYPTTSAVTAATTKGIEYIYFCTGLTSNKAKRIEACNRASVCFCDISYNITLVGSMEILTDAKTKKEMWYAGLSNIFEGFEDPNFCVLKFKTERYNMLIDWQEVNGKF